MSKDRKGEILKVIVQEYIDTAQPVGSTYVANAPGVKVSSATVRNDMAYLEAEGYLCQPHTSSGRVPTEKGYRFFVDMVGSDVQLDAQDIVQVGTFFRSVHGEIGQMLTQTSQLLSRLTDYAAVVVAPQPEAAKVRSVQFVLITNHIAIIVIVLSNGAIEKYTLELDINISEEEIAFVNIALQDLVLGKSFSDLGIVGLSEAALEKYSLITPLLQQIFEEFHRTYRYESDLVAISGTAQIATSFDGATTVRDILHLLEQQYLVVSLLSDVLDRGLHVAIGTEMGVQPLANCSVVVAPYAVEGETIGAIGVLGPTRMNYSRVLAAVNVVSERLSSRLREG